MSLKRVSPKEAEALAQQGYTIVDVRSVEEFVEGHPAGAFNLPFLRKGPMGMVTNQDFERVFEATFADKSMKLVIAGATGARSTRAAEKLLSRGYSSLVEMRGGFSGEPDAEGAIAVPGWQVEGLPVETGEAPVGRNYRDLNQEASREERAEVGAPATATVQLARPPAPEAGMNRFADPDHMVECKKLHQRLPALKRAPYPDELGTRIQSGISAQAWDLWVEHSKMVINEYRLNPLDPKAQEMLREQCEQFLFGEGQTQAPEGYVPEKE